MAGAVRGNPRIVSLEWLGQDRVRGVFHVDGMHRVEADFTLRRHADGWLAGVSDDSDLLFLHATGTVEDLQGIVGLVSSFCRQAQGERSARREAPEPLVDLDRFPWRDLHDAYGPAGAVPGNLRALLSPVPAERDAALGELWGTVWHQGTVYDCSPLAATFLAEVAGSGAADPGTRVSVLLLLASLAAAGSYVLPDGGPPSGRADRAAHPDALGPRELDVECHAAVSAAAPALAAAARAASDQVRAATLAVVAATGTAVSAPDLVDELERHADARLAAAALLTRLLGGDGGDDLLAAVEIGAAVDAEAGEYLDRIDGEPVERRARELACELVERFVTG